MKVDWKVVAASPGYTSLKECYIHDVYKKHRSKEQLLKLFNWVICRAKHYAHIQGKSIEDVLYFWELDRGNRWWLSYYSKQNQPKLSNKLKPQGLRGIIKYYRNSHWVSPEKRKQRICEAIISFNKSRPKKPKRWTKQQREHAKYRNRSL